MFLGWKEVIHNKLKFSLIIVTAIIGGLFSIRSIRKVDPLKTIELLQASNLVPFLKV